MKLFFLILFASLAHADLTPVGSSSGGLTDAQLRNSPVPVTATIDTTGLATSAGQTTTNSSLASIKTDVDKIPSSPAAEHTTALSPNSCRLSDGAAFISTLPVSLAALPSLAAGSAVIGHVIVDTAPTTAVTIGALPALTAGSAVIGHVIVDTAPTTAVTIAALPALTAGSAVIGHVVVDTAPTTAVTIASLPALAAGSALVGKVGIDQTTPGTTNGVQVNAALPAGTNVIGHVIVDTAPSTAVTNANLDVALSTRLKPADTLTGVTTVGAVTSITNALPAGTNLLGKVGIDQTTNGTTNRVNIGSDGVVGLGSGSAVIGHVINDASSAVIGHVISDTGSVTNATLSAETTKVIGTVNVASGQTVGLVAGSALVGKVGIDQTTPGTTNGVQVNAALPAGTNVIGHVIVDTAPTTTVSQATTGGNPCLNPASTLVSITGATSGTAAVQIVALSGSTKIYICSMTIIGVSGTTPTFSLVQGTGSNCVTSQTKVVQAWTTAAGTLYAFANPVAVGVAGNELCYLGTGTSPVQNYQINYVQQ